MKKILILLLIVPFVFAQTDWFASSIVKTNLNISSTIDVEAIGQNPTVESLEADVIFVPQNTAFQAVRFFESKPSAVVAGDRARYTWTNPPLGTTSYRYDALVEIANNAPRVRAKIPFPIDVPRGFEKYVKQTQHIDENAAIIGQARKIVEDEDDLFVAVSKVAFWVKNNVEYDLSTLTADVSQPASWVLENKVGVCDELTSLFIAMMRSLDIPARFVSGVAFTESPNFPLGWGAHGWAEVYFPGVGWVPFDPTFGEFGWVDPGHIKLKDGLDPQEPTTTFEWRARDVNVEVHDLDIASEIVEAKGVVPFEAQFTVKPTRARVGFGSYNVIMAEVENRADYYVAVELRLAKVADMNILQPDQQVVLGPREKQRVFWVVQMKDMLNPNYQYEIPLRVSSVRNDTATSSFVSGQWDIVYSKQDAQSTIEQSMLKEKDDIDFACALENDQIFSEEGKVNCVVKNNVEQSLDASVCFGDCRQMTLQPSESVPVSFDILLKEPGAREIEVFASTDKVTKKAVLTLVRLDTPKIKITEISAPSEVQYGDAFTLSFSLARQSVAFPENVKVEVKGGGAEVLVDIGSLIVDQDVKIGVRSEQLYASRPNFKIIVTYEDKNGKQYAVKDSVSVRVNGVSWWKRIVGFFIDWF